MKRTPAVVMERTLPGSEEGVSPSAHRYDPPLVKVRGVAPADVPFASILATIDEHFTGTGASADRALAHGGIHLAGKPLAEADLPVLVAEGTRWVAYGMIRDPDPVDLGPGAVLATGPGWLAVDKPAWLPTQRTRASAVDSLERRVWAFTGSPEWRAVHRLDRTTSGVVLFAEGATQASVLQRAFQERTVRKRYVAVVAPPPTQDAFSVSGWIGRAAHKRRFVFEMRASAGASVGRARQSESRFNVKNRGEHCAWVDAEPVTGRTHQLRVHLAHVGSPVAGDDLYGVGWEPGRPERALLHAAELGLSLPDGTAIEVEAPLPGDMVTAFGETLPR